jgi:hypothetical protein
MVTWEQAKVGTHRLRFHRYRVSQSQSRATVTQVLPDSRWTSRKVPWIFRSEMGDVGSEFTYDLAFARMIVSQFGTNAPFSPFHVQRG